MTTLYLVPTPLGDPDDITLRALRILREASAVAADDLDAARRLLEGYEITTPMIAYDAALEALNSGDVALISSGGTPGIGDAAQAVVQEAIRRGIRVEPLPGADAAITALVLSGLPTDAFVYMGRLPDDLSAYAREQATLIFATNDVSETLMQIFAAFGNRRICVAARLTQETESIYRGMLRDALEFDQGQTTPYDIMVIVEGALEEIAEVWDEVRVELALRERLKAGEPLKLAAKAVAAEAGWDRRAVYAIGVDVKKIM